VADAHHLAGALHLRAEYGVGAGELNERQHNFLNEESARPGLLLDVQLT
jgi:hypothetical protein